MTAYYVLIACVTLASATAFGLAWLLRRPLPATLTGLALFSGIWALAGLGWGAGPAPDLLLVFLAGLLGVVGGGPITTVVFTMVGSTQDADSLEPAGRILRGGAWIGALERAAIFGTLVAGWPEGLALVLALKGLGRYPELRSQEHTGTAERFIIGTFASALWACACAGLAIALGWPGRFD
ncbi:MAG: hypothetical protein ACRCYQ_16555 [Nocardioides sp.]